MINIHKESIVFQEVPGEVSLSFSIAGCDKKCSGCHSRFLWDKQNGTPYTNNDMCQIIEFYKPYITNVLFLGGDNDINDIVRIVQNVKDVKFSWYSGSDDHKEILKLYSKYFNYIKIGSYNEAMGGLDSINTNQRLYKICDKNIIDITSVFWKGIK